jgi:lipid-A-disaccharide synthase
LLQQAKAALVTSGTATLETALFRVPQVVCYYIPMGKVISFLRRHILKVKYISLVNLVADKEVVRELVADTMTVANVRAELDALLNDVAYRENMLREYDRMIEILGPAGASRQAASKMIELLSLRRG